MLEINAEVISIIEQDATIQNLTGYTINDTRVYAWNPSEDVIYSNSKKASITYRSATGKRPPRWSYPKQFANSTMFFKVVSMDQETTDKIGEQLIALLDRSEAQTPIETTNWRVGTSQLLSYNDAIPEGTPPNTQWVKMVTITFSNVFKKNPVPV